MTNLYDQARSILLAYVRAFLVFAVAALGGAIDPTRTADIWWSIAVGAGWAAIPAGLRAIEAVLPVQASNLAWRLVLSFARAGVATAAMTLVGPIHGAGEARRAFTIALAPAVLRALQEVLDGTAPTAAIERSGARKVIDVDAAP